MSKEKATDRVRVFPSTYQSISVKAAKKGKVSMAQIIDEQDKLATIIGKSTDGAISKADLNRFRKMLKTIVSVPSRK